MPFLRKSIREALTFISIAQAMDQRVMGSMLSLRLGTIAGASSNTGFLRKE
jgi:hypothetical protein